jgi:DNA-binding transcriptional MerR regulator
VFYTPDTKSEPCMLPLIQLWEAETGDGLGEAPVSLHTRGRVGDYARTSTRRWRPGKGGEGRQVALTRTGVRLNRPHLAELTVTAIGAVAAELGVSVEALRYYERAGLSAPVRDTGGRRDNSEFDVNQLRLVTGLRAVGIPIESIRQLLSAKVQGGPSRGNAERALDQLAAMDAVLRRRQAEIRAARRLIRGWAGEIQDWLSADAGTP